MRRTSAAILPLVAVAAGFLGVVLSPDVAGARVPSTAKGTTMCFVSGTITASPALTLGSGKATTLTLSAGLQGCTGPNASKVTHATLTGKSKDISASCVGFENALTAKVSYTTTSGSLATTKLAFSPGTLNYRAMRSASPTRRAAGRVSRRGRSQRHTPR
jgi:hypothetical protein